MICKFMTTVALGSLFVGGLAASHLAFAQDAAPQVAAKAGHGKRGGSMAMADANKDGAVSRAELTAALDARFARFDADSSGQISKAEFAAAHDKARSGDRQGPGGHSGGRHMRGRGGKMSMMGMGGGFGGRADADKDGTLTRAEFMTGPLAMFDKADANKDGTVTAAEQQAARAAMREQWKARKAQPAG